MASKPKAYELVLWIDPASEFDGWQRIDKMAATAEVLVYSIGWPVREDSVNLYLAMDFNDESVNTIGKIPLNAIKARKRINLRGFPMKAKKEPHSMSVHASIHEAIESTAAPPGAGSQVLK